MTKLKGLALVAMSSALFIGCERLDFNVTSEMKGSVQRAESGAPVVGKVGKACVEINSIKNQKSSITKLVCDNKSIKTDNHGNFDVALKTKYTMSKFIFSNDPELRVKSVRPVFKSGGVNYYGREFKMDMNQMGSTTYVFGDVEILISKADFIVEEAIRVANETVGSSTSYNEVLFNMMKRNATSLSVDHAIKLADATRASSTAHNNVLIKYGRLQSEVLSVDEVIKLSNATIASSTAHNQVLINYAFDSASKLSVNDVIKLSEATIASSSARNSVLIQYFERNYQSLTTDDLINLSRATRGSSTARNYILTGEPDYSQIVVVYTTADSVEQVSLNSADNVDVVKVKTQTVTVKETSEVTVETTTISVK